MIHLNHTSPSHLHKKGVPSKRASAVRPSIMNAPRCLLIRILPCQSINSRRLNCVTAGPFVRRAWLAVVRPGGFLKASF